MSSQDPIVIAAEARVVLQKLHQRDDTVIKFKTNHSGFAEDAMTAEEELEPGHFRADHKVMEINLDKVLNGKPVPHSLSDIKDWRRYPVLAGVAAHESAHARWSLWDANLPESIPNPAYDEADPATHTYEKIDPETGDPVTVDTPPVFPVDRKRGELYKLASALEEPRVERLGVKTFTRTWRKAMQLSSTHLIMEQSDEDAYEDLSNLDSAVRTMIAVGGRLAAGTLGVTTSSRLGTSRVMDAAEALVKSELADRIADTPGFDPFFEVMTLISEAVYLNDHEDGTKMLDIARRIIAVLYPERDDNPDEPGGSGAGQGAGMGSGGGDDEGEEGDGMGGEYNPLADAIREALDEMVGSWQEEIVLNEDQPEDTPIKESGGHGSVKYNNPRAPQIDRYEDPNAEDRALYHKMLEWMQEQVQPTVSETTHGQWLPTGGARLNVRNMIRDDLAGHRSMQRSDWDKPHETIKEAPPVKVAIMLDGSGSMSSRRRETASIAWAAANAAAQLPESLTVSVVYGSAAQVTQKPGHDPIRQLAISRTDGPTENFGHAVELVEDALNLEEDNYIDPHDPDGKRVTNNLMIIVSDLWYGGTADFRGKSSRRQGEVFTEVTKEWVERGYRVVVIGADTEDAGNPYIGNDTGHLELADSAGKLFERA